MNNKIKSIFKKELREMFRDKKSLSMMLLIPIMIPLMVLGMSALFNAQMNTPVSEYNRIGFNYEMSSAEKELASNMDIQVISGSTKELKTKYDQDELDLYVTKEGSTYTINGEDNQTTSMASSLVNSYFTAYKEYLQNSYLTENKISPNDVINIISVKENISTAQNFFGSYITNYAFLFIIMAIAISAMYPATDATAGEKERGTLETLLTFPIKSRDIIIGKYLSVTFSSMITGILSLILTVISLLAANNMFEIYKETDLMLSPVSLIFATIVIIAYSFLISGLNIAVASKCKTFKEAQSALTPVMFISFFPGMIAFLINLKTSALLSLIPFLNYTLIFTDITNGVVNYANIFLMLLSTIVIIIAVLGVIIKQYKSEKILFTN
ncbi:MAG: ABC transporter permease [Eubacterium sp.]|nr:ABC transporter permease [Eubacterium sp.]